LVLVLTRNAMLYAQLFKRLLGRLSAPGFHVFLTLPDAFNGFLEILKLPLQVFGKGMIERGHCILAAASRICLELSLTFRLDGYYIHDAFRVVVAGPSVNDTSRTCQPGLPGAAARIGLHLRQRPSPPAAVGFPLPSALLPNAVPGSP